MASMASSDPLSSPSPTPPPEPAPKDAKKSQAAGLDGDSELSELTEEEQDTQTQRGEDDDDMEEGEVNTTPDADGDETVGAHGPPRSRGAPKKRRSLVPEQMWDWAYKQKRETSKGKAVEPEAEEEEEEEEEQPGPPKPMEEEEDEDEEPRPSGHRSHNTHHKVAVARALADDEEEDGDVATPPISGPRRRVVDEEESVSNGSAGDPDEDEDGESEDGADTDDLPIVPPASEAANNRFTDAQDGYEDEDEGEEEIDTASPKRVPPEDDVESENEDGDETASEEGAEEQEGDDDAPAGLPAPDCDVPPSATLTPVNGDVTPMELDVTAPSPAAVAPVAAAAAASSIMAGSEVIEAPSPGSSSSSRSPSPPRDTKAQAKSALVEAEKKHKAAISSSVAGAAAAPEDEVEGEVEVEADNDVENENENEVEAEGDLNGEGEGDQEDMEVDERDIEADADLQPAHRAEALDVLATIEFKFAMLRERVYVEKMDALAWEENLVAESTHPELLHLHTELSKRRDKRLQLAEKRRSYEMVNTMKRRRVFEEGVWNWWRNARDELQTDMIAETNRKRRKLERDRRASERPQPGMHFSVAYLTHPTRFLCPPPCTTSSSIIPTPLPRLAKNARQLRPEPPLVYPTLSSLTPSEIASDLELLYTHRRGGPFDMHRAPMNMGHNPPPMGPTYDQYGMIVDASPFGAGPLGPRHGGAPNPGFARRQPPGPSGLHHEMSHGMGMEHEMIAAPGMGPMHMPPGGHVGVGPGYMQQGPPQGQPSMMSRSISPVHVMSAGGPKTNGWGSKMGDWPRDGRRMGEEEMMIEREREMRREREMGPVVQTELEKERERDRERREMLEREREMQYLHQQQQQIHRQPQPPHLHRTAAHVASPSWPQRTHDQPAWHDIPGSRTRIRHGASSLGAPSTEVINLASSSSSKFHPSSSGPSPHWRDERDGPVSPSYGRDRERDRERERARAPPPLGPHERIMTPFVMTPTQAVQNTQPGGRHPPSAAPSRRGSPGPDDEIMRPNPQGHFSGRPDGAMSPPRPMSRLPPPPSPSSMSGLARSPPRANIPLPPPPYPAGLDGHFSKSSVTSLSPSSKKRIERSPPPPPPLLPSGKMAIMDGLGRPLSPPPPREVLGPAPPQRLGSPMGAPLHRLGGPAEGPGVLPMANTAVPPVGDAS
ncbi:hypothetical protein EVG20_g436 [Dentipellis fragilis]|uniref:Uncharacterized protein n=1 Tax=Dentipellis fragilis TaxID=205917 RepID=A0A4Y9ZCK5_9AGAM|nr:hypothetical protein EVG20_g436 [Dentipellis fragilis]